MNKEAQESFKGRAHARRQTLQNGVYVHPLLSLPALATGRG